MWCFESGAGKTAGLTSEKGLRRVTSRKEWPQDVKRKALIELMKDTPRQLLAKEIWLASSGAASAFERQQRYSRTAAVMSMVGHVLGLGDRHLDNILIDFATADVVHIDHNVAFDKGLTLRVPEVVPFRLTPIMQQALGLTGVEGTFRIACEETLAALRTNATTLLGLLEVFTWEPLSEWTAPDGTADGAAIGREERQGMEVAVSLSLLASRLQEQQRAMQEHRDFLVTAVPSLYDTLAPFYSAQLAFQNTVDAVTEFQDSARALAAQGSLLELQLTGANVATQNAESALAGSLRQMEALKSGVEAAAKESRQWWDQHEAAVQGLLGKGPASEQVTSVTSAASQPPAPHDVTLLGALASTGLGATILPQALLFSCQSVDARTLQFTQARAAAYAEGVNTLQGYRRALSDLLPKDYVEGSAVWLCVQSMERAVSGVALADLAGLLEGLAGLGKDGSEVVMREYRLLKDRSAGLEKRLKNLVSVVPKDEPFLGTEKQAFAKLCAWLEIKTSDSQQEEAAFFGRFGSCGPVHQNRVTGQKAAELTSAAHQVAAALKQGLEGFDKKSDVRTTFGALESVFDKCRALQKAVDLTAATESVPRSALSAQNDLAQISDAFASVNGLADAFERELLPELSAALLRRDADVREALLAVRSMWNDVSGLILAAEELVERASRKKGMERRLVDMCVRLEGLRLVAGASGFAPGGGAETPENQGGGAEDSPPGLSQESVLESHQTEVGLSPGETQFMSQENAFEHGHVASPRSPRGSVSHGIDGPRERSDGGDLDAVREAARAADALEKEVAALRESLRLETENDTSVAAEESRLLEAVRGVKERFAVVVPGEGPRAESVVSWAAQEVAKFVGGAVGRLPRVKSAAGEAQQGVLGIWNVPGGLQTEAGFVSQLGLLATVAEACMLTAGPMVLLVQVETAGVQSLWDALRRLVMGHLLLAVTAAYETVAAGLEGGESGHVTNEGERLLEAYVAAAAELRHVHRRKEELEGRVLVLRRETQRVAKRLAQLEWEHEAAIRRTMSEADWQLRQVPFSTSGGGLKWWQRESVLTALTRVVTSLTGLQEAVNAAAAEGRQAERELDALVAFVGGGITTVLRQKMARRRQVLLQEEQNGLALNRLCRQVLEMEAARNVEQGSGYGGLGLEQTGRVWVDGCARLLTQFHVALSQHMQVAEALQTARSQQTLVLERANAHVLALTQLQTREQGLRAALSAAGESLRQQIPNVTSAVQGFLAGLEKHTALTKGSEGVLGEILAATEGAADDSTGVRSRTEDTVAVQKELIEQVRQLQDNLNPLQTLLNLAAQTLPTLPSLDFNLTAVQPEGGTPLALWTRLFLGELLPILTKAEDDLGQLAADIPENAEEVLDGVLDVAETAAAHAAAALQRAAGIGGEEVHGDALAQNAAPVDTRIEEELGEAAAISRPSDPPTDALRPSDPSGRASGSLQTAPLQSSLEPRVSPKTTQERVLTPTGGKERPGEGHGGGKSGRDTDKAKPGAGSRTRTGERVKEGFRGNKHARAVVETVRAKLEGRINAVIPSVPASSRVLTVPEQVESLLRQATSIDNLASMYEGWTAWI